MKQWKVVTYMDARLEPYRTLVSFLGEALGPDYNHNDNWEVFNS